MSDEAAVIDPVVQEIRDAATAAIKDAEAEHDCPTPDVDNEPVQIVFPTRLVLLHENLVGRTGSVGRFHFVNGVSELMSYRDALQFSLNYRVTDLFTGVYFTPVTQHVAWRASVDTNNWRYGNKLDDVVIVREEARANEILALTTEPVEPITPPVLTNLPTDSEELADEPVQLDVTQMDARAATMANVSGANELLGSMRDLYGARFLRQLCEARGLKADRAGDAMILTLVNSGITVAELELARPKPDRDAAIRDGDVIAETETRVGGDGAA